MNDKQKIYFGSSTASAIQNFCTPCSSNLSVYIILQNEFGWPVNQKKYILNVNQTIPVGSAVASAFYNFCTPCCSTKRVNLAISVFISSFNELFWIENKLFYTVESSPYFLISSPHQISGITINSYSFKEPPRLQKL